MATNKKIPITRNNKWMSKEDFDLEVQYGREFVESDLNQTVVLYRVDREASQTDALYGEANKSEIRYKTPVELKVIGRIMEPENKTYNDNGSLNYLQPGQFVFGVYQAQLDELQCEIIYGDYVGYAVTETEMVFYSVVNPGQVNYDNQHTIFGYLPAFRTITCAPLQDDEFNGI
jgi:hypothetical protein